MNIRFEWHKWLPVFSAAGEGAGGGDGGGGGAADVAGGGGDGAGDAPVTTALGAAVAAAGAEVAAGDAADPDKKAEGDGDAAGNEAPAEPFALAAPEGLEGFSDAYSSYSGAANDFLTANPGANARDALAWAAEHQANQVREAGKAMRAQFEQTITGWETEARSDADIGGDKYDASVKAAVKGLTAFGSPGLVEVLNDSGLGSHPEVIKAFAKVGRLAQESPVLGGEGGKGNVSFAGALYGRKG